MRLDRPAWVEAQAAARQPPNGFPRVAIRLTGGQDLPKTGMMKSPVAGLPKRPGLEHRSPQTFKLLTPRLRWLPKMSRLPCTSPLPRILFGLVLFASCAGGRASCGQADSPPPDFSEQATWRTLEERILVEVNLLRSDPSAYARHVLVPLKKRTERVPQDPEKPYRALKVFLAGGADVDYIWLDEGGSQQSASAVIDEALAALRQARAAGRLKRNPVLEKSARYFSKDFLDGGKKRPPHVDSLGRSPRQRIMAFGATPRAIQRWNAFRVRAQERPQMRIRVFQKNERHYWFELEGENGYRYWSVPQRFGDFVVKRGRKITLPRMERTGWDCDVTVDARRRQLRHGDQTIAYPIPLPVHGENVVWGDWSWPHAARGLVAWWVLDPGITDRGHRQLLLDPEFEFAGIGCAWSEAVGWVATLDVAAERLAEFTD